ncbi:hypothetical protein OF83DRAFT_1113515, partial [Amylostereum chailletii]
MAYDSNNPPPSPKRTDVTSRRVDHKPPPHPPPSPGSNTTQTIASAWQKETEAEQERWREADERLKDMFPPRRIAQSPRRRRAKM